MPHLSFLIVSLNRDILRVLDLICVLAGGEQADTCLICIDDKVWVVLHAADHCDSSMHREAKLNSIGRYLTGCLSGVSHRPIELRCEIVVHPGVRQLESACEEFRCAVRYMRAHYCAG